MWECWHRDGISYETLGRFPEKEKGKEKNRFTLKTCIDYVVFYFRLVSVWSLCLILKSIMLIWSASWKCVFYLKYLCIADIDLRHTSQWDTFTPLKCGPVGRVNFYFDCFQRDVCVHACMCEVMFGAFMTSGTCAEPLALLCKKMWKIWFDSSWLGCSRIPL